MEADSRISSEYCPKAWELPHLKLHRPAICSARASISPTWSANQRRTADLNSQTKLQHSSCAKSHSVTAENSTNPTRRQPNFRLASTAQRPSVDWDQIHRKLSSWAMSKYHLASKKYSWTAEWTLMSILCMILSKSRCVTLLESKLIEFLTWMKMKNNLS